MKKITYSVAFVATLLATSNTFAQQGFGTNTPHRSAAVEIKSTNKGLLIPRIALTSATQKLNTSVNNANSLLVYNDGTTLPKGYYYWDENYVVTPAIIGNGTEEKPETPAVLGKWVAFSTVGGSNALGAENALTLNTITNKVELGGSLNRETQITLNGYKFTIATGNNDFNITSLTAIPNNVEASFLLQDQGSGKVYNGAPNMILDRFLKGKNGIKIEENDQAKLEVKLGGTIDEVTNLHIADNASVSVTGLKRMDGTAVTPTGLDASVAALGGNSVETGHLIPVGTTMNGTLKVATAKEIVDAGIVSVTNTISGTPLPTIVSTDRTLITSVNSDSSEAINMTALVQSEQIKYELVSTNNSVSFQTTQIPSADNDFTKKIDLAVNANAVGGGQALESTDLIVSVTGDDEATSNTALLQGLTVNIKDDAVNVQHINEAVAGQGLVQEASGALKVNVNNGLQYGTENTVDDTGDFVQLGGDLTRATTLTTTATNTLAIQGLQTSNIGESKNVIVDKDNKLRIIDRVYSFTDIKTANYTLEDTLNVYEEVNVVFKLSGTSATDVTFTLPASANFKGQTVNVSLANDTNDIQFLVIKSGNTVISEGSMPYQSWVFKSNGNGWDLVARK